MDELTTTGETEVAEWQRRRPCGCSPSRRKPWACPARPWPTSPAAIPPYNAAALTALLDGQNRAPIATSCMLNAAAAFLVADKVETLREGVELAAAVLDDGRAQAPWPVWWPPPIVNP